MFTFGIDATQLYYTPSANSNTDVKLQVTKLQIGNSGKHRENNSVGSV